MVNNMNLFTGEIANWQDWSNIFQSIPAFGQLAQYILRKERLPAVKLENLTPGTNAVFRAGGYVVKIYAPAESGMDQSLDLQSELFSTRRANVLGVPAPKLVADGFVDDKYRFAYLIMEYIEGAELCEAVKTMSDAEKLAAGRRLRAITDRMNTPCEPFNRIDPINDTDRWRRWDKYPERFRAERAVYIKAHDFGPPVFVHGDLCGDNILLSTDGELYIIDFADAVRAPACYEHALVVTEYDPALLRGYFAGRATGEVAEECFNGLLIHDFGGDIAKWWFDDPSQFDSLDMLKMALKIKIEEVMNHV